MKRTKGTTETSPPSSQTTTLGTLAEQIREADELYVSTIRNGLQHARRCGELLIHAKELVKQQYGHGHWEDWVRDHTEMKLSTARAYMRVGKIPHDEWEQMKERSIEDVLKAIGRKPKPKPEVDHDDDEDTGLEWTDPELPDAELGEVKGGVLEEAEHEEEYHTMSQAELLIRQAIRLVGVKLVKKLLEKLEKEKDDEEKVH